MGGRRIDWAKDARYRLPGESIAIKGSSRWDPLYVKRRSGPVRKVNSEELIRRMELKRSEEQARANARLPWPKR